MTDSFRWLFSLLKPYRFRIVLGALMVALTVCANIGLLATSAVLLAKAALLPPLLLLMPLITGVRFFGISRAVMRYLERLYNHSIAFQILGELRLKVYLKLEPLVPDSIPQYTEGKMYNQLINDIEELKFFYLRVISMPLGTFLVIILSTAVTGFFVFKAAVVLGLSLMISCLFIPLIFENKKEKKAEQRRQFREKMANDFTDVIHGLKVLKGKADNSYHVSRLFQDIDLDINPSTEIIRYDIQVRQILFFVSHLTCLIVLWISAIEVVNGELEGVFLAMIGLIALASFETIEQFPQSLSELRTSGNAAMDLLPLLDNKQHQKKYLKVPEISGSLLLDNITFNFHQPGKPFIKNLNLMIPEGARVAFVGTSGSGKSTVAKLLMKLWTPDDGHIYWGKHVYDELAEEQIREHIGLLEQMPAFFNTSLKENLLLANPQASDCELWEKLEQVNLKELVSSWPKGLESSIGENGMKLSGGERQRLALARLLLKNVRVLILDEPMQNIDGINAGILENLLDKWSSNKTVILITHELKNLPSVDFIYMFKDGKIAGSGTHQELLRQNEDYQQFWRLEQQRL